MPQDKKPADERATRASLFKNKLNDIRDAERKKTKEANRLIAGASQLVSSRTVSNPEEHVGVGKERHHLLKDPTTGLYSEKFIKRILKLEVRRAKRYKNPLGIIVGTMVNGEDILKGGGILAKSAIDVEAAKIIQDSIRDVDVPGVLEDGTFLVVCPETGEVGLHIVIERLLRKLNFNQEAVLKTSWGPVFVFSTATFGTSMSTPEFILSSALERLTLLALETRNEMDTTIKEPSY